MISRSAILFCLALSPLIASSGDADRFVTHLTLPTGHTAVISESEFEARSIGSYSILLYAPASPGDETTFFIEGRVRKRDGVIEAARLDDVAGDAALEILIIIRSVGTGSYLSADAYSTEAGRLELIRTVSGLPPDADPVAELRLKH